MSRESIVKISEFIIRWSFILLFFLVPLFFTPYNYELFEYNKMMLTYGLTVIIVGAFLIKSVTFGKLQIKKTPFDIPIIIFLASQILSTIFSIDRHTSIFGYYSRFHGGLLSTISYISLYYVFVSEFVKGETFVKTCLYSSLISTFFVSIYAILQRLGIDKHIWVQDVQNRVFSTLGQPNWLAAYFSILTLITVAFYLINDSRKRYLFLALSVIFYTVIIFTKSRSGFVGFWIGFLILSLFTISKKRNFLFTSVLILLIATFIFGTPFSKLEKYTFYAVGQRFFSQSSEVPTQNPTPQTTTLESGGTESGVIRKIVWKGAIDIFKHYPLIGSGVETFAYSYYQFRPQEHNLTSEWDFLYNKAHNEYLNFAATTGITGLTSYLLLIGCFLFWAVKKIKSSSSIIIAGLLGAYITILVTNFFGFSVVLVGIFFFLIPALSFILSQNGQTDKETSNYKITLYNKIPSQLLISQKIISAFLLLASCYLLLALIQMWRADYYFNLSQQLFRSDDYLSAYNLGKKAVQLNQSEPFYKDNLAQLATSLSITASVQKEEEVANKLKNEALSLSLQLVTKYPNNLNYWKTRTRVLYALSEIDQSLFAESLFSILKTWLLAPHDPKIAYNAGLLYAKAGENEKAIETLIKASELKPDYYEPYFALALFYEQLGEKEKAVEKLEYILKNIRPDDKQAKDKLEELSK